MGEGGLGEGCGDACADPVGGVDGVGVAGLHGLFGDVAGDAVVAGEALSEQLFAGFEHAQAAVFEFDVGLDQGGAVAGGPGVQGLIRGDGVVAAPVGDDQGVVPPAAGEGVHRVGERVRAAVAGQGGD